MNKSSSRKYIKLPHSALSFEKPLNNRGRFHILWFKHNADSVDRILEFQFRIMELLDPTSYRILCTRRSNKLRYEFWKLRKGKVRMQNRDPEYSLSLSEKGFVYGIRKQSALSNAYLWALAYKLKFLDLPRNWRTRLKATKEGRTARYRLHVIENEDCIHINDSFYHNVKVPIELFLDTEIWNFMKRYKQLRGLKQIKNKKMLEKAIRKNLTKHK